MKTLLHVTVIIALSLCIPISFNGQTEGSAFTLTGMGVSTPFARDYQTLGINPGNLDLMPKYDHFTTFGLAEGAFSAYSSVLTKPELRQNLFQEDIKDFSQSEQKDYALAFANSDNAIDADLMTFGLSIRTNKAGTFAFTSRDRIDFYSKTGPTISELIWLGYTASYFDSLVVKDGIGGFDTIPNSNNLDAATMDNIVEGITSLGNSQSLSQLLQGTKFGFSWFREFNLGWGKKIFSNENLEIDGGIGVKMLIGQGMVDITAQGGTAQAFSALSPVFQIDYGTVASQNPSALEEGSPNLKPVGFGYGADLGLTVVYKKKFILSAAVTDIGQIKWDGNLYKLNDVKLTSFENSGLESVNFIKQIEQLNGSDGLLTWTGEASRVTKLPSTMRIGFGYEAEKYKIGIDVISPLSSDMTTLQKGVLAIGGEFSPMPWLHLQAGYSQGGNYGTKIPVGIYFTVGKGTYEFGLASRDLVTFFRNNSPTISAAFGFLRFRF